MICLAIQVSSRLCAYICFEVYWVLHVQQCQKEAKCWALQRFHHEGLRQLQTKQFCSWWSPLWSKCPTINLLCHCCTWIAHYTSKQALLLQWAAWVSVCIHAHVHLYCSSCATGNLCAGVQQVMHANMHRNVYMHIEYMRGYTYVFVISTPPRYVPHSSLTCPLK